MSAYPPGLSGTLWPIHPKPLADELLSCWLIRIARGFGTTAERFCRQVWSETVWKGDIDVDPGEHVLRVLAASTGTAYEDVAALTLAAYGRRLSAPLAALFDEAAGGKRLRFCGVCLKEDAIAYYRREWRLSFVAVCARHETPLLSNCGGCGRIVNLQQIPLDAESLAVCFACGGKVYEKGSTIQRSDRMARLMEFERRLRRMLG
jgi:hypothetical protein